MIGKTSHSNNILIYKENKMENINNNSEAELILENVRLRFVNDDTERYGKSIVVEIEDENEKKINDWTKANGIKDKDGNDLKVLINNEHGYKYFYFRPIKATEYTDITGTKELSFSDLAEGSTISLTAMAIPYETKDELGQKINKTTYRLMAVIINKAMSVMAKESAQRLLDKISRTSNNAEDGKVDLSDIPF